MRKTTTGFTIVELLIVIVVIAILATISIVAYNGIQNRANDSAVKNDLANFAKAVQMQHAIDDVYPRGGGGRDTSGGSSWGNGTTFPNFRFKPSRQAYRQPAGTTMINFVYCEGPGLASGNPEFRITAISASGQGFTHSSMGGLEEIGQQNSVGTALYCAGLGLPRSWSYGYYYTSNMSVGWTNWTE